MVRTADGDAHGSKKTRIGSGRISVRDDLMVKSTNSISDTLRAVHTTAASPRPRSRIAQPQATSDETLMAQIAGRDRSAMAVLYARHHVRVFRFVLRLVQDESTAEDLRTEVWIDVWRRADRFERRSAVSTWVLSIARFKALSFLKRRPEETLNEPAASAIEDPADNPDIELEKKDTMSALRKCLTELPPQHREIVDLVYYHEKSARRGVGDCRHPEKHGQDAHAPRTCATGRAARARRDQAGLNTGVATPRIEHCTRWLSAVDHPPFIFVS